MLYGHLIVLGLFMMRRNIGLGYYTTIPRKNKWLGSIRYSDMENSKYFDILLFDKSDQQILVVPVSGERYETVLMKANRLMSEHGAAAFKVRSLPYYSRNRDGADSWR